MFTPGRIFFRKAGAHHTIAVKACMLRLAPWLCVVLLAVLSLVPGDAQIRTGAPGIAEHVMAYCGTAVLFTVGYPARGPVQIILGLAGYAGVLEIAQAFVPGRYATLYDLSGGVLGVILGCLIGVFLRRKFPPRPG